jgi:hypothetical protein
LTYKREGRAPHQGLKTLEVFLTLSSH